MTQRLKFAFYGRVSTEDNQDPTLSLPRQLTNCERAVTGVDGEIVAHFYDVESGAGRFDERGSGKGLIGFDIPIPRGGGLPDLLELATLGGINAVVCESISRVSRNPSVTFRVEEDLRSHDVKLWAADEPWEESFGSIVLRHVNVGVARGYLHELKVKSRQGLEAACRQGRHIGGIPLYGYRFKEVVHPNPHRAKQGRRMRILEPDPPLASVVRTIFEWYVVHDFSLREITKRLNSDLDRYPSPIPPDPTRAAGSWSRSSVWEILHNPKYTGYQVWNRRGKKRGNRLNDSELWIWSDELAHEPLVSRDIFEKASTKGLANDNAGRRAVSVEQSRKPFLLRSFVRCGICGLRLQGHRNGEASITRAKRTAVLPRSSRQITRGPSICRSQKPSRRLSNFSTRMYSGRIACAGPKIFSTLTIPRRTSFKRKSPSSGRRSQRSILRLGVSWPTSTPKRRTARLLLHCGNGFENWPPSRRRRSTN